MIDDKACRIVGGFSFYFWHLGWNYFTWLTFEIMYRMVRPTDLKYGFRNMIYNVSSHLICLAYTGIAAKGDTYGPSALGTCFIASDNIAEVTMIIPLVFYFPLTIMFMSIAYYRAV